MNKAINIGNGICSICKRKEVSRWCDYIIDYDNSILFVRSRQLFNEINRRGAKYQCCSLPMCEECAFSVGHDTDFCPHHFGLHRKSELPTTYQRKRQQEEILKINLDFLGRGKEE